MLLLSNFKLNKGMAISSLPIVKLNKMLKALNFKRPSLLIETSSTSSNADFDSVVVVMYMAGQSMLGKMIKYGLDINMKNSDGDGLVYRIAMDVINNTVNFEVANGILHSLVRAGAEVPGNILGILERTIEETEDVLAHEQITTGQRAKFSDRLEGYKKLLSFVNNNG